MSQEREVRTYEYVNHPYEGVRDVLLADPLATFRVATNAASDRAESVAAALRVNIAGVDVGKELRISIGEAVETVAQVGRQPSVRIPIEWEAADRPGLFPLMKGALSLYPITDTETQLDFAGTYAPPMGALGGVLDSVVGHRIADASVHRFLADVAQHLRATIGAS
jgi:methionine aminopeptidase